VDAKLRWQALQARLTAARGFMLAGDRVQALQEIDAALQIDPDFLAAHALRDRLVAEDLIPSDRISPVHAGVAPATSSATTGTPARSEQPLEAAGYQRFEERARRRRVDRQLQAARTAIERRGLSEAAAALDEVIELDPNVPELVALTKAFDDFRRSTAHARRGPSFAAAAVFAVIVLGASWIQDPGALWSRPIMVLSALVPPASRTSFLTSAIDDGPLQPSDSPGVADRGSNASEPTAGPRQYAVSGTPAPLKSVPPRTEAAQAFSSPRPEEAVAAPPLSGAVTPVPPENLSVPASSPANIPPANNPPANIPPANNPPANMPPASVSPATLPAPASVTASARPSNTTAPSSLENTGMAARPRADDELLVKQALQRYRVAYDGLDARSAQAVWPAVNQAALARAFDGLSSQALTFDRCDVQLRSETATATCHGTARYVPKIGSREPRTERRVWNFTLRKGGTDWTIDSARVDR
jgi:hypothetical protein